MAVPLEEGSAGHEVDRLESVVVRQIRGKLSQVIVGNRFSFLADEPVEIGGSNLAPNPIALLLAGLGTWMVATLSGVAYFRNIPLEGVEVRLTRKYNFTATEWSPKVFDLRVAKILIEMTLEGPLTDEQRRTLMHAAEHCPVHNTLAGEIRFDHRYV